MKKTDGGKIEHDNSSEKNAIKAQRHWDEKGVDKWAKEGK